MNTVHDLIAAFGGTAKLAAALTDAEPARPLTKDPVYNWGRRGLPRSRAAAVLIACARAGIPITVEQVTAMSDPADEEAA